MNIECYTELNLACLIKSLWPKVRKEIYCSCGDLR